MNKKIILPTLIIAGVLGITNRAFAGWPATDVGNAGTHGANVGVNSAGTANQVLKTLKDYGLDTVAYTLAQKLGQKMATLTINKTTGGADNEKDPNFVQDFGNEISKLEEQQLDLFTTKLIASNNPFARDIATSMSTVRRSGALPQFTLGSVLENGADWKDVSQNISAAGQNGWDFYAELAYPENTAIGSSMLAKTGLSRSVDTKKEVNTLKTTSSGYLPQTECNLKISDYKNSVNRIVSLDQQNDTLNTSLAAARAELAQLRQAQTNAIATYGDNSPEADAADNAYYAAEQRVRDLEQSTTQGITGNSSAIGGQVGDLTQDTAGCIEEFIKNPVATTANLANSAGQFGMDMTKNIQGWGQIVAGLFVSLFNGFVNEGLSTLKADYGQARQANIGGPEQLTQRAPDGSTTAVNFANAPYNIIDLRNDLADALETTDKNVAILEETRDVLLKFPVRLAYLDMALPGPDIIGLNSRMDKYYDQQTAWLQKTSVMGDDEKRNTYQSDLLAMIERDFDIAKAETLQDINDDTQNIPGASAMRTMISSFNARKNNYLNAGDALIKASDAKTGLNQTLSDLKASIIRLRQVEPNASRGSHSIANINLIFTPGEWRVVPQSDKDALYNWARQLSNPPAVLVNDDEARMRFTISKVWDFWERPEEFMEGGWSDPVNETEFLKAKNTARGTYDALKDTIPRSWEISKNEQQLASYKADIIKVDQMITDADKIRQWSANPGGSRSDLYAYVLAHKNELVSEEVREGLTLPNFLNTPQKTPDEAGCHDPSGPQATEINGWTAKFAEKYGGYWCFGNFGHIYDDTAYKDNLKFSDWIDSTANVYLAVPTDAYWGLGDFYWRNRILQFVPDPAPYGTGWIVTTLPGGDIDLPGNAGKRRDTFCRFSQMMGRYGLHSAADIDHEAKNFYCSSKWTDVTVAEAVGLFILNQLN